jgi:hypothetical protein
VRGDRGQNVGRVAETNTFFQKAFGDADIGSIEKDKKRNTDDISIGRLGNDASPFMQMRIRHPFVYLFDFVALQPAHVSTAFYQGGLIEPHIRFFKELF